MERKDILRWLAIGAGAAAGAAIAYELAAERWRIGITRGTYAIRNLPPELDGLKIAHLSDLHMGRITPVSFIRKAADLTNSLQPDLVVMTGDYVDDTDIPVEVCSEALAGLDAPLGVFAILGNHDHWVQPDAIADALGDAGVRVLRNESVPVGSGEGRLWIAGLEDTAGHREDFGATLNGRMEGEPVVLLSHSPDVLPRAHDLDIDLVLAGHTHGGQIRLPIIGAPHAPSRVTQKYVIGSRRLGHTRIHVSRGVGMTLMPVRFGCPPEIGLYTLTVPVRARTGNPLSVLENRSI